MKFREHIINSIQYIEDIDHLKDYAQSIQEIETLDDAKYRTMHIVNKMCEYEGIEKMYPFVPHDDILEMYARIEVKAELEGIGIEPAKQRELQI
jgi:hypothetical protein